MGSFLILLTNKSETGEDLGYGYRKLEHGSREKLEKMKNTLTDSKDKLEGQEYWIEIWG